MHANPIRDPRARQNEEDDSTHHALRRAPLTERARLPARPDQQRSDDEPQGEDPGDRREENVEDDDP